MAKDINQSNNELSFRELILLSRKYCLYLLSRWIIIIALSLLGAIIGFAYAYLQPTIFTATTTFVLEDEKGGTGVGNLAGLASLAGVDLGGNGGSIFQGDNILQLYKSRRMLEKTLFSTVTGSDSKELLIDRFIQFNSLKDQWKNNPLINNLKFKIDTSIANNKSTKSQRLKDSVVGTIVSDINRRYLSITKPDKKLSTIQVDVKAKDEFFAKEFNEQLVKNVNDFYITTKTKKTLQSMLILQHKTDSVRDVMNGAIYSAVAIADATPNLNPNRQVQRLAPAQKAQFSAETNKAVLNEMIKNLELTKMSLLKETPLIQVIDKPIYPLKAERLGRIKGLIVGGFILGFISTLVLLCRRIVLDAVKNDLNR
jgi:uncharacterized protein involved in exopolysaccharide biosynthesis